MDKIFDLLNSFSKAENADNKTSIPKEILDQYPYGDFPIKYTKTGQEIIRKSSENRFSQEPVVEKNTNNIFGDMNSIASLLPLFQILGGQKKQPKDVIQLLSKLLFKDNPEMSKLFQLLPNIKSQEIDNSADNFPNTAKVNISSLNRID